MGFIHNLAGPQAGADRRAGSGHGGRAGPAGGARGEVAKVAAARAKLSGIEPAGAAREIRSVITASVEQVEQGTALADRAGATMRELVDSVRGVTQLLGEISSASAEQSRGVSQVEQAVVQMDQVTQQNAALVEQSAAAAAAAAESLKQQVQELVRAVAVFKLGGCLKRRRPGWIQRHPDDRRP